MDVLPRIQENHASRMNDLTNLYMEAVYMEAAGEANTCLPDVCLGTLETMIRDLRVHLERQRAFAAAYPEEHIRTAARTLARDRAAHRGQLRQILHHVREHGGGGGAFDELVRRLIVARERRGDGDATQ
jgi:hypothetical protein